MRLMVGRVILLLVAAVVLGLSGCDRGIGVEADPPGPGASASANAPRRIVSLFPSWTETFYALGAGDRLVGRSRHCTFPDAAKALPSVGDGWTVSTEAVLRLQPDLVVVFGAHLRDRLRRLGLRAVSIRADSMEEIYAAYRELATLAGVPAAGDALVARVRSGLRDVASRLRERPRKRVLYYVDPRAGTVVGRGNFVHELLEAAGAENVVAREASAWPTYSLEAGVRCAPDVVLYGGGAMSPDEAFHRAWPSGTRLVAVEAPFVTRSGPRLAEAVTLLARLIHEP